MPTRSKLENTLRRMTAMQLAAMASDMGVGERYCYKFRGGPVRKDLLIASIIARQAELDAAAASCP